jgi:mevalonate kinase
MGREAPTEILGAGRAPGKVILCGEHAVVYGRPALAVPVTQAWAEATIAPAAAGAGITILAADLGEEIALRAAPADHPLAAAVRLALTWGLGAGGWGLGIRDQESGARGQLPDSNFQPSTFNLQPFPDWRITVRSTIPIASGMGSGAAVSAAIIRAVAEATNDGGRMTNDERRTTTLSAAELSAFVYEIEWLHHGTPSGVDNTVIAYGQPVYFVRGQPPQPFAIGRPFTVVIADTGIRSSTKIAVGDVRRAWEREPARFEALFDQVAEIVAAARTAIAHGEPAALGPLLDTNHALLQEIGVSCGELDALVAAARSAGALGAKLSGAGRGGNMIALVTDDAAPPVAAALTNAGAARVIVTQVGAPIGPEELE